MVKIGKFNNIAENVDYLEPIPCGDCWREHYDTSRFTIEKSYDKDAVDFELYGKIGDKGLYEYYVWINNTIDTGTIYLKVAKIGKIWDTYLYGKTDVNNHTKMEVHSQSNGFGKCGLYGLMKEVDNGSAKCGPIPFIISRDFYSDNYLARFELWYKPKNKGNERKLATKIYKVYGFID
jgi:hypothetical protein